MECNSIVLQYIVVYHKRKELFTTKCDILQQCLPVWCDRVRR